MEATKCKSSDLVVNVKTNRTVLFKAGSDLSSKVNRVGVDVVEEINEDREVFEISLKISSESCENESEI